MERILHIGKFSQGKVGGIETALDNLINGLSPFFQLFKVVSNNHFKLETIKKPQHLEVNVPSMGLLANTPICPTMAYHVKKMHKRFNFSIVHLHLPNPMAHFSSEFLPASVKRIVSWHSDIVKQKHLLPFYQPWVGRLLEKSAAVIVATHDLAEKSSQLAIARKKGILHVIPYGIDINSFNAEDSRIAVDMLRKKFKGKFIIFSLGRHVAYKGFCYLIEAMSYMQDDCILLLGGEGPLTMQLKKQVKGLGLTQRIHFLGQLPTRKLTTYFHACHVFCMSSIEKNEAFGLVQLEAMACTKPVVSCDLGNDDMVNQDGITGLVVPPKSPVFLANALTKLYQEPVLRRQLGEAAYSYVKEKYTYGRMVNTVQALYEDVLR
ncbi:glycosyl transferase group 1 [Candidatus Rickettsiella viridis]|uniref:Glycosyl transferase group 1 n=1 Tax=Candidatus Rickettsiella viridis TaxID=676208 RepID=A0A2Z5UU91_9COXI|nr:glycosyltransferase [Candidatus Rickettsiella viridis]BBB15048.1 glycosyl transferase group 1 [Candidatus Rickettsiella viridis]